MVANSLTVGEPILVTIGLVRTFSGPYLPWFACFQVQSPYPLVHLDPRPFMAECQEAGAGGGFAVWGPLFAGYVIASLPLVVLFFALGKFYVEGLIESGLKA